MKIPNIQTPMIATAVLGLLVAGLAFGVIYQQIGGSRLAREIGRQRQSLSDLKREAITYRTLSESYTGLSSKLGRAGDASWSGQMPFMMDQLTGIMQSRGLKLETLRPEQMTLGEGVSRFPLRISFRGRLSELVRVVSDIEQTIPILSIEQLNIRPESEESDVLQADMTIASFVVHDKSSSADAKQSGGQQ